MAAAAGKRAYAGGGPRIGETGKFEGEFKVQQKAPYINHRLEVWEKLYKKYADTLASKPRKDIKIELPDGTVKDGKAFETSPMDIAMSISKGLAESAVVAKVIYKENVESLTQCVVADVEESTFEPATVLGAPSCHRSSAMGRRMQRIGGPLPLLSLGLALCTAIRATAFLTTSLTPPPLMARSARKAAGAVGDVLVPPKRPASSYMSWLNDNRESIVKKLGTNTATLVAKEAGAQWKKLSAAKKKPYEAAWVKAKAKYTKDLEDFKAAGGVILKPEKTTRTKRAPRDPNLPKRPLSSYMLWLQDNRATIVKSMPAGHKITDVMREAGAQWSKMTAAKKKKYEKAAADAKAKYLEEMEKYKR